MNSNKKNIKKDRAFLRNATNSIYKQTLQSHPPQYPAQSKRSIIVRMQSTAAQTNVAFTYAQLAGILGIIGTSTTTSSFLTTNFRLRRIRIWAPVATAGTSVTAQITFTETATDFETPPVSRADSSVSFDHPAYVGLAPPKGSLLDKWHASGQTNDALAMTYPSGAVIDFHFDFVLPDYGGSTPGPTISGGTAGNLYHKSVNSLVAVNVNAI